MKQIFTLLILLTVLLTGCAGQTIPDATTTASNPVSPDVTLTVFEGWDGADSKKQVCALSADDQAVITALFYDHDKEVLDSPLDSIATVELRQGEEYLNTSMEALETLTGRIGGELVVVELDERECDELRQLILSYTK